MTEKPRRDDEISAAPFSDTAPSGAFAQTADSGALAHTMPAGNHTALSIASGGPPADASLAETLAPVSGDGADRLALTTVDPSYYADRTVLAKGGMGQVVTARDRRLGRTVAIKELRADSPELRVRFEREAMLTARLEHPSIVGIHEVGRWPSGEPFYAMKLVTGKPLDTVIAAAETLAARLALVPNVLAVADALAYAHQRRIIHRDLKPQNVVLGEFGETVVIDWGIAKDLATADTEDERATKAGGEALGETAVGDVLGTPSYMPPEQAEGEIADERADVYAIGAILYHLLAGRPPYTGKTLVDLLDQVRTRPPTPLAELEPSAPPDLLAIVARAMARDRTERYRTARELADDLRRFQSGQLVGAHRYSTRELVRRWIRKNRRPLAVGAIATLALLALGVFSVVRIVREQHRTEAQRVLAESRRVTAETQRAGAETLTQFMLGDLVGKLRAVGKVDLLEAIARKTIDYYEHVPVTDERQGQSKRAYALNEAAAVLMAKGEEADAMKAAHESLALGEQLVRRFPDDVGLQRTLRDAHTGLAASLMELKDLPAAVDQYKQALTLVEQLKRHPVVDSTADRVVEAEIHGDLSTLLLWELDTDGADREARIAYEIAAALQAANPDDPLRRRSLALVRGVVAEVAIRHEDWAAAGGELRAGTALLDALVQHDEHNVELQQIRAGQYSRLGFVEAHAGTAPQVLASFEAAIAIRKQLTAWDAANLGWQLDLASAHEELAETLLSLGKSTDALSTYEAARAVLDHATNVDPASARAKFELAKVQQKIGDQLLAASPAKAEREFRTSIALVEGLVAAEPANLSFQVLLVLDRERAGEARQQQNDLPGAIALFKSAVELAATLKRAHPDVQDVDEFVTQAQYGLAGALEQTKDLDGAAAAYGACLDIFKAMLAKQKGADPVAMRNIGEIQLSLARVVLPRDPAKAIMVAREAVETYVQVAKQFPAADSDALLAQARGYLGDTLKGTDPKAAIEEYRAAIEGTRKYVDSTGDAAWRLQLAKIYESLSALQLAAGDTRGSAASKRAAKVTRAKLPAGTR